MNNKQKKEWILSRWNTMNGDMIAKATAKYFQTYKKPFKPTPSIVNAAKEIFGN